MSYIRNFFSKKGFSLLEVMIGVAVFMIFVIGVYSGIQMVFKIVYYSRLRILETQILNEQIEIVRNMPFENIGIISGSPSGTLTRNVTTTRDGINFLVTRTIRNIDDSFDGTIGGTPNDTAPADYKLAEIEIICINCTQRNPLRLSTYVAPKNLEGNSDHGALFIQVFDANGVAVPGATVEVAAPSTNPALNLTDVTDNEGMLRLVDVATGTTAYSIFVSKNGYTTDQTNSSTISNPNPIKQPATVVAKDVTKISFSIDLASSLALSTIGSNCQAIGNVPVNILGTKIIGTEPEVFKVNNTVTTNASGLYNYTNLEWDAYSLQPTTYDLVGSIPALPINLAPGIEQPVKLILGSASTNSLLINVSDSVTEQPLANSTIQVVASPYDVTKTTGVGYVQQTDWSGGTGQLMMSDFTKYWANDGKIDGTSSVGNIKLKKNGNKYYSAGSMESSIFDFGENPDFVNLIWTPLGQPSQVGANSVSFQIATSNSSTPSTWDYVGYDGTAATYFNENNFSLTNVASGRYLRYKMFLKTNNISYTPTVSDLMITYITSCIPPGQGYFGGLSAQDYVVTVSKDGYQTSSQTVTVSGDMILGVKLVAS